MNTSGPEADVVSSVATLLTDLPNGEIAATTDYGSFFCSVENFDQFTIIRRNFETAGNPIEIPFTSRDTSVQMIFSLDGQSVFNDRSNPYILSPVSHCINLYKYYECRNLLGEYSRQHDISFRVKKNFYADLIAGQPALSEDRLPAMLLHQKEFNTINQHLPADPGILGILKNILDCPFKGDMKNAYIREHLRALLTLQLYHFNPVVSGDNIRLDGKIASRDKDVLQEVKNYIDDNFLNPASLESLSKRFGINEFKLKHGFKVLFDTSPMRYLQYKRLEYSLFLLRETNRSIKMIADEIGYSHAANFTIAFTRTFGNSPMHYRTAGRENYTKETEEVNA